MGLIKAALGSINGVLADQWKEYFYCEAMPANILVSKGQKQVKGRSSNTKGETNIISNGSVIAVNEGQCMIIVDQGKIVDISAEPGEYVYSISSEPSIFYGGMARELIDNAITRFGFGGQPAKDQRVYFINTKEITGNKYGTASPIPFRVVDRNVGLDVDISIRIHGEYSYRICNPILFYKNVCGNVAGNYTRDNLDSQLKTELMTALNPAMARISDQGIRYSSLPAHTMEISEALNTILSDKWSNTRGIEVASFGVSSVTASEEDENMIKQMQRSAAFKDPNMAAATMVGAQSDAMMAAARNQNGAAMGFMGMNMAAQAGGVNAGDLFAMGAQQKNQAPAGQAVCPKCGRCSDGKFCPSCGTQMPTAAPKGGFCPNCGSQVAPGAAFCSTCGNKL